MPAARVAEIRRLYTVEGQSPAEIASQIGATANGVYNYVRHLARGPCRTRRGRRSESCISPGAA
jgi:DNA-binding CsgD family transcriptional regulator